jgi:pentatricopeptide repeat protein
MNAGNLRPDLYVHNLVIETCGVCGEVGEALNVLEGMKTAGIAPNSKTYAGIMQGIAKRGEWVHAKDILGSMIEDGLTPDEVRLLLFALQDMKHVHG